MVAVEVLSCFIIFPPGKGSTSFKKDNGAKLSGEKKYNIKAFSGQYFLRIRSKKL